MRAASDGLDRVSGNCQYINDHDRGAHLQLISVSVFSGGDHNRGAQTAKHSTGSLAMMLLGHGSDGEPQVYAQLGQHHPRRITVSALGDSLLFENLAA